MRRNIIVDKNKDSQINSVYTEKKYDPSPFFALPQNQKKCEEEDVVHNPSHYQSYKAEGIDCITAMRHAWGDTVVAHFCIGNAMKYLWRHSSKGGFQDINKAIEYLKIYKDIGIIETGD